MKIIQQTNITLLTPAGKITAPVEISYDDEANSNNKSELSLYYGGIKYTGNGTDHLSTDTFADLQLKLPKNVKLACCMTCIHGNMCPYSNDDNLLFCTKDLKIICKKDMCDLFDHTDPFRDRAVASLDYCEEFVYQSDDCYTYNDYLHQLNKKRTDI